jgi:2-methylisocitrate lyase-like PEP mutase family enzyme
MTATSQNDRAKQFRALHAPGNFLRLTNAWDVASARLAEDCGAKAVATSSAAVAWAHGYPDGEKLPKDVHITFVREIVRVVQVPISADIEGGYSDDPDEAAAFVIALAHAGAVGINLEDGHDRPPLLVAKIHAIRKAVEKAGVDVYVNARTDVYLKSLVPEERALDETLARGRLYRDAGADGLFVPALVDTDAMRKIADAIALPLNVLTRKDLPAVDVLRNAGARRLSSGGGIARAAYAAGWRAAAEILDHGRYDTMLTGAEGLPNLNALMEQ